MKRFELWKLSWLNVISTPARSLLTVLGFSVGIAAILAVVTLGEAGKEQVIGEMKRIGIDRVWVNASETEKLNVADSEHISRVTGARAEKLAYAPLNVESTEGKSLKLTVVGCEWSYLQQMEYTSLAYTAVRWDEQLRPAIVGRKVAEKLSVNVGDWLLADDCVFRIVGIVEKAESVTTYPMEDVVLMPLESLLKENGDEIHEIQVMSEEKVDLKRLEKLTSNALEYHGTKANVTSMHMQLDAANNVVDTFVNVLKWVALVCVLAGGIGVMNILLVSVRERRREIGIMKSLGTTPVTICILFLLESMIYAAAGGCGGMVLGSLLIRMAGARMELDPRIRFQDCIMVLSCAFAAGIVFGVLPAWKASRLSCIDALRQE